MRFIPRFLLLSLVALAVLSGGKGLYHNQNPRALDLSHPEIASASDSLFEDSTDEDTTWA